MIVIAIKERGPIPEGRFDDIVLDYLSDAVGHIGQQGLAGVHGLLNERIKEPTPYYETQIKLERGGEVSEGFESDVPPAVVHDRAVIYGWWLEGIGSRNHPVTRFRGYRAFRETAAVLNRGVALRLAKHTLTQYMPRLRGEA
jgi:hypothetical protein